MIAKLPKKKSTLVKKIMKNNPWKMGERIVTLIDTIWDKMQDKTVDEITKLDEVKAFCKLVCLDHRHFVVNGIFRK